MTTEQLAARASLDQMQAECASLMSQMSDQEFNDLLFVAHTVWKKPVTAKVLGPKDVTMLAGFALLGILECRMQSVAVQSA